MAESGYPFERDLMQFEASRETTNSLIDYKRILYRGIRYWYVVLLSLSVTLVIAYSINRYSTKIYPIKASIIIKENQENVGGKLLYNNALVNPYRNFYNELYIIRSLPLISGVVKELNLNCRYFREGDIKTTEIFDPNMPINFTFLGNHDPSGMQFGFKALDNKRFSLEELAKGSSRESNSKKYAYGDTVELHGIRFIVNVKRSLKNYINKYLIVGFYDVESIAGTYLNRLKASWQEQGASVVNLEINGSVPSKGVAFIDELIKQYQQYDLNKKNQAASRTIKFIDDQLNQIKDSLSYFERQVELFKEKNVITNLDGEALRLYQRVEESESNLGQLKLKKNYLKYLANYLSKGEDLNQVVLPSSVGVQDPIMTNLLSQLIDLQMDFMVQKRNDKVESYLLQRKKEQIDKIRKDIIESVNNSLKAQKINEDFIHQQIKQVDDQLAKLPESERRLVNLQRSYSLSENLYIFLMQKRAEAGISKASTTSDIVVVNPPRQIGGPITPKPFQNYTIAVIAGLVIPFLCFMILELINDKVQSREDIEKVTNIPLIGGVGHNALKDNLIVNKKPKSGVAESFRALRSNLNFFTEGKDKKTFLITSSISGEGKTFSTINLATVLAFSGKKTLIVGADMRRPKIYDDLYLTNDIGLSNFLSAQIGFNEILQPTSIENLSLVSAGPVPPNPSELLMSNHMQTFMDQAQDQFDFVILDTPPIGLVTDAFILSKYANHTVFLIRQDYTPKQAIKTVQEFYENGKIKNVSILFNDIKKIGPGYGYGSGYGYYYGYGYGYGYGGYRRRGDNGYYKD